MAGVRSWAVLRPAIRPHHERWDGGGYPDGLAGEAIPLAARIVAVAAALDPMTTDRPYRAARSMRAALAELRRCAGSQFDSRVAAAAATLVGPTASEAVATPETTGPSPTLAERHATAQTAAWRLYATPTVTGVRGRASARRRPHGGGAGLCRHAGAGGHRGRSPIHGATWDRP
ncbi:MAG TPA: HD domain-containing phosphohydrolase, partial [Candidatus Dormibacteraeota bacterium]|nr:HD domain-containing phosphohydrolase [Candidatus Dormibacteraeota bacterium]